MSRGDRILDHLRVAPGTAAAIADRDPGWTGGPDYEGLTHDGLKREAKAVLARDVERLSEAQELLWASDSRALLVVFQAMDAAGKDSAIEHVMSGVNPQGVQVFSFKTPSAEELDHNFLWRTAKAAPERGRIGIFNRSHYEEVVALRVHPEWLGAQRLPESPDDPGFWEGRFEDINTFERHLDRTGTKIVKFFLHVSRAEQKRRFIARLDEPNRELEVQRGRCRRAGPLGRVHGRVRRRPDGHVDALGTVVRRPGRLQVGHAGARRRDPRRHDPRARSAVAHGVRGRP